MMEFTLPHPDGPWHMIVIMFGEVGGLIDNSSCVKFDDNRLRGAGCVR